jgi:hypothetical protein
VKERRALLVALILAFSGCSPEPSPDDFTKTEIDGIVAKCGAHPDRVKFNQGAVVISEPSENDVVGACVLRELKNTGKANITIVGNELHTRDSK